MEIDGTTLTVDEAQSLRIKRMSWGIGVQACTALIVIALYGMGQVPGIPVVIYLAMIVALDIGFSCAIRTGFNLRFQDPSLAAQQIALSVFPIIFIMYYVSEPQARIALLLMGTSSLLFGMFSLSRRGMLLMVGFILGGYLSLLLALYFWAPTRINLMLEGVIVFAYASVLAINTYLCSLVSGMRLKLKQQNRELVKLATLDPLTGLPNRRSLMNQLARESARCERRGFEQSAICVGMLDVDYFKEINDTWGHEAGDAVLREIGDMLRTGVREGDFIGRFGGEEFVVILPETGLEAALKLVTRIRNTIASRDFSALPAERQITVSVGVAEYRTEERIEDTLKRADDALYEAKSTGRNRVVS